MSAANGENSDAQDRMLGSVPGVPAAGRGPAPLADRAELVAGDVLVVSRRSSLVW